MSRLCLIFSILIVSLYLTHAKAVDLNLAKQIAIAQSCQQLQACGKKNSFLEKALWTCQLEVQQNNCTKLATEKPELKQKIKTCEITKFCKQANEQSHLTACARGYKNAMIDLGQSIVDVGNSLKDYVDGSWSRIQKTNQFVSSCTSVACKRQIVKDDYRYSKLSDEQLATYSPAFLYTQAQSMKGYKANIAARAIPATNNSKKTDIDDNRLPADQTTQLTLMSNWAAEKAAKYNKEYSCLTDEAKTELQCYVLGNIVDPTMIAGYYLKSARALKGSVSLVGKQVDEVADAEKINNSKLRNTFVANSEAIRLKFTKEYLQFNPTTVAQNEKWIEIAESSGKAKAFFDVENSLLKKLNDTLKDKDFVTSLTNYHKKLTFDELEKLKKKYPQLTIDPYSDFKSVRIALSGKVPANIDKELNAMFKKINSDFATYAESNGLIRRSENTESWFRSGYGETADEANISARLARSQKTDSNNMFSIKDPIVQETLNTRLSDVKNSLQITRSQLKSEIGGSKILDKSSLDEDAFDIIRKNMGSNEKIKEALQARYQIKDLSSAAVESMQKYVKAVDEFSPGIHVRRREVATLEGAEFGGLSADVIGLGSMNLKATAEAIEASDSIKDTLVKTRLGEKDVTQRFSAQKNSFKELLQNVVDKKDLKTICSGDDCVAVATRPLTREEKVKLTEKIGQSEYAGRFRLAYIPDGIKDHNVRSSLATHGESLEKILRKNLSKVIPPEQLKSLTFAMDMKGKNLGQGAIDLIIGKGKNTSLTNQQNTEIQKIFKASIEQFNSDLQKNSKINANYRAEP